MLAQELASTIASGSPLSVLAQATFHITGVYTHTPEAAGIDDLDEALAAGFQTRLPRWDWQGSSTSFGVQRTDFGT